MRRPLVALAVLFAVGRAEAFSIAQTDAGYTERWDGVPIPFTLQKDGSSDIKNGSELDVVRQCFQAWADVSCTKLAFSEQPLMQGTTLIGLGGGQADGINEIAWIEDSDWPLGPEVLAITIPLAYQDGRIVEADIAFNGYQNQWTTTGQFGRADVRSTALHEIGHFFGLQHVLGGFSQNDPPTMAPVVDPYGKTATLEGDDELGACYLYPATGKFTCGKNADCPYIVSKDPQTGQESYQAKLVCDAGLCKHASSTPTAKGIGEACAQSSDCQEPLFCQPVGPSAYCAKFCTPSAKDCPGGFACFPYSNGNGGACLPSSLGGGTTPNGDACSAHSECKSGTCYPDDGGALRCRAPCSAPGDCGAGEVCFYASGYATSACLPEALVPSEKVLTGDPCNEPADCESGICLAVGGGSRCRDACTPGDACPSGLACTSFGGNWACVPEVVTPPPPAACTADDECASGVCREGACRAACEVGAAPCAEVGQACQRLTAGVTGGTCEPAGAGMPGAACTGDAECATLYCAIGVDGVRQCLKPCGSPAACVEPTFCQSLPEGLGACYERVEAEPGAVPKAGRAATGCATSPSGTSALALLALLCMIALVRNTRAG